MLVTSPPVLKTLDEEGSKKFLRYIFTRLFNFCFLISAFVFLFFALGNYFYGIVVSMVYGYINKFFSQYLSSNPRINKLRDLSLLGEKTSGRSIK